MTAETTPRPPVGEVPPPPPDSGRGRGLPQPAQRLRRLLTLAGRHRLLLVLLAIGTALRIMTQFAHRPAILFVDSYHYLGNTTDLDPTGTAPVGYGLMLRAVLSLGGLALVPAVQHLAGLAMAVVIYALLLRWGVRRWLAALATVPVLLDAYQLQIEQNVMSDVLFQVLVVAALATLTWRPVPGHVAVAVTGLLVAVAIPIRVVGQPLILVPLVYLLVIGIGRLGWRARASRILVLLGCFAAPLLAYATFYYLEGNTFTTSGTPASALYGRAATFADCRSLDAPDHQMALCPDEPVAERQRKGVDWYTHHPDSPRVRVQPPEGVGGAEAQLDFALRVIRQQPLDFARAAATDFLKGFRPTRTDAVGDVTVTRWQFQHDFPRHQGYNAEATVREFGGTIGVSAPLASFLRGYQLSVGYTPGVVLGLALLAAVLATLGVGRARRSGLRAVCFAWAAAGGGLLLTAAVFQFSWRYQLPGLVLLPAAGALAVTALTGGRRRGDVT